MPRMDRSKNDWLVVATMVMASAEALVYDRALAIEEIEAIEAALKTRYGL